MNAGTGADPGLRGVSYTLPELLALRFAARRLRLKSVERARAARAGGHRSRIRGRGMSFVESRLYQPGDDARLIDWRVTARSLRPHTKVFEEERERPVFVIADFGPTMRFGTRTAFKHVVAAEVCALVGWAALRAGDRIGALLAAPGGHAELKPAPGRRAVMRLLHALEGVGTVATDDGGRLLRDALKRGIRVVHTGSLVFVVSDFHALGDDEERLLARLRRHNDVILVQVLDRLERRPPPPGDYPVSDGGTIRRLALGESRARVAFEARALERRRAVVELARRHRLPEGAVTAGEPVVEQLAGLL